jgi:hypothetical protein
MEPEAGTGSEDGDGSGEEPGHVDREHEAPEHEPPGRRPKERTDTLGDVQRALRIRGARPTSSPGAARSRASANGVKRQSRAAAAGARCRSRADVAGWRGRWQCTATRHSLPAVRAAAARRPLAGCVCAAGCRPS